MRLFCLLSVASLVACNAPDFTAAKTAFGECAKTSECKRNGTVCAEGVCVEPGLDWDGGAPVDVGPALDASTSQDVQAPADAGLADLGTVADVEVVSDTGSVADAGVAGTEVFAVYNAVQASLSQQACVNKGGSLAWVSTEAENLQLLAACDQAPTSGICRIGMDEPFVEWLNGTPITFRAFADQDGGDFQGTDPYVFIRSTSGVTNNIRVAGEWDDGGDSSVNFICRQSESSSTEGALAVVAITTTPRPNGSTEDNAARTCSTLHDDYPNLESGIYWIDPDGEGGDSAWQAYCEMETDGGGWTRMVMVARGQTLWNAWSQARNSDSSGDNQATFGIPVQKLSNSDTGEDLEYLIHFDDARIHHLYRSINHLAWDLSLDWNESTTNPFDDHFQYKAAGGQSWQDCNAAGLTHHNARWNWSFGSRNGSCGDAIDNQGFVLHGVFPAETVETAAVFYSNGYVGNSEWAWVEFFVRKFVKPNGSSAEQAAPSCKAIKDDHPNSPSAAYWLDPDGEGEAPAYRVWCDMEYNGGGWQLVTIISNANNQILNTDNYYAFRAGEHVAEDPANSDARGSLPLAQPFTEVMVQLSELAGWHLRYVASSNDQWTEWYRDHLAGTEPSTSWGNDGKHMAPAGTLRVHIKAPQGQETDEGLTSANPYCYSQSNTSNLPSTRHRMAILCNETSTTASGNLSSFPLFDTKEYHELNHLPEGTSGNYGGKILFWVR